MKYLQRLLILLTVCIAVFSCQKEYSNETNPGLSTSAQWSFTEGSAQFKGPIDTVAVDTLGGYKFLTINGHSSDNKDQITLQMFGATLQPGTYKTPFSLFAYMRNGVLIYQSNQTAIDSFTIVITKLDSTGVAGTFSGKAYDSTKTYRTIVNGVFSDVFKTTTPVPPVSTDSGQVVVWSTAGCGGGTSTTPITVTVGTKTGQITTFSATQPSACDSTGGFYLKLPVGTYPVVVKCGTDSFKNSVTVVKNTCTKVQVSLTGSTANTDYFPMTTGSNWASLWEGGSSSDSNYTFSTGQTLTAGKTYNIFGYADYKYQYDDTLYYRKDASPVVYYQYFPSTTNYFGFDVPTAVEFVMLNENLTAGAAFLPTSVSGTIGGTAVTGKIDGTITAKNVTVTVSGVSYSNVIKVQSTLSSVVLGVTTKVGVIEQWFAKGIGVIKYEEYVTPPFTTPDDTSDIIRYQVF
jgi:hypothetical protein